MLTSVFFVDQHVGWVMGAAGTLRRTTNGGESWSFKPLDTQQALYHVSFASPIGWMGAWGKRDDISHSRWWPALG